jgi:hypothetical protein
VTRRSAGTAVGLLIVLAGARAAESCSCIGPNPACAAVFHTDAVFTGQVMAIADPQGARPGTFPTRRVHLRVTEAFKGVTAQEVDVDTGLGGGDCGYPFIVGVSYVVFASQRQAGAPLATGICSPTRLVAGADADLAFLRSLAAPPPSRGRIYGAVTAWDDDPNDRRGVPAPRQPFSGARVVATGATGRFEASSGAFGAFEILAPVGTYSISFELPEGKYAQGGFSPVELTDPRGCVEIPVAVHSDGHISGRVRDSLGGSISGLTVELVPADRQSERFFFPRSQARTTPGGTFEITKVPPGRYVLGFNTRSNLPYPRTIFSEPDTATTARVVDLRPGERVSVGDLTVPASIELHTITGVVRDGQRLPIAGAKVYLKVPGAGFELVGDAPVTGSDGRFELVVLRGYRYDVYAELVGKPGDTPRVRQSDWVPLSGSNDAPLTLIIRR